MLVDTPHKQLLQSVFSRPSFGRRIAAGSPDSLDVLQDNLRLKKAS